MKLPSKKKIAITAFTIAALGLLTLVGVLVVVRITHRPKITIVTISVDDLAEMKTLVHKYLNERRRVNVSPDPQNNPNIAGAPVIDPAEMSPDLAARQKEDVEKLLARGSSGVFDDFAIYTRVKDVYENGDDVVLHISALTSFHNVPIGPDGDLDNYSSEVVERYFTFAREGNRWILTDAKLIFGGAMPPSDEPSVEPFEEGSSRVLANPPPFREITMIPKEVKRLDEAATKKIANKWAIDEKTMDDLSP